MFAFLCSIIAVHASSLVGAIACACLEMHDREELLIRIGVCRACMCICSLVGAA